MFDTYKKRILGFYKNNRRMPSFTEIMKLTGFKSKNAVSKLVDKLIDAGIVSKDSEGKLIPENIFGDIKMLSQPVSAGYGAEIQDELIETVSLQEWLVDDEEWTFMLTVQGDSMIDAGIFDGDTVLVEKTSNFRDGQIVVALLNDGYTVKYLRKKSNLMRLEPANKKYRDIVPTEENQIELVAVVKAVIRKF